MSKENKKGLSYYSIDTDRYQDKRIKRLKHTFSVSGIAVYDYLLCEIYRVKGCFMEWDESTAFDVTEYFGLKESTVNEIVKYCGHVGLFNEALLSNGILTSISIQSRYIRICKAAKRSDYSIPEICRIIPVKIAEYPEEKPKTPEENDKEKESKEKESKGDYLIKIGNEKFYKKGSEVLSEEYKTVLEDHMKFNLKNFSESQILEKFDEEYPRYDFKDRNHLSNSVKSLKEKLEKNFAKKENGKSTSKSEKTIAGAYNVLHNLGINPDDHFSKTDPG